MDLEKEFINIIKNIEDNHYSDNLVYFQKILKEDYKVFVSGKVGIIVNFKSVFKDYKVGYARGGFRFDLKKITINEFNESIESIKLELKQNKFLYVIIENLRPQSEFTDALKIAQKNSKKKGTVLIYPKENWISKFKSKDRYNLNYAGKKGVEIEIFKTSEFDKIDLTKFNNLLNLVKEKSAGKYLVPSIEQIQNISKYIDGYIILSKYKDKYISFNISLFNFNNDRIERVFAGSDKFYSNLRAPEYLEVQFINFLFKQEIKIYDLWMLHEGDGYTDFKLKFADEIIEYAPRSILYSNKILGIIYFKISKIKEKLLN